MASVKYSLIYENVLNLCGIENDENGINQVIPGRVHWKLLRDMISNRLKLGWQAARWPSLCRTEQRTLVYSELDDLGRHIPLEQDGENTISEVFAVRDKNPAQYEDSVELPWHLSENGIQVVTDLSRVWVFYRQPAPVLSGNLYSNIAGSNYAQGDQVYDHRLGNFYEAAADIIGDGTDKSPYAQPDSWEVVGIPDVLRNYLIRGGYADYLRHNGQMDLSHPAERDAQAALDQEVGLLETAQGQYIKYDLIGGY